MNYRTFRLVPVFVLSAMPVLNVGHVHAQTPGQIPVFDLPLTGSCNMGGGNNCVNSVITQDPSGKIGIRVGTPVDQLDVNGAISGTQYNIAGARVVGVSGVDNLSVGVGAGASNTTGTNNAFFGSAGVFNTEGSSNAFFGSSAGVRNTTGRENAYFGTNAGPSNTEGINHAFFGFEAGRDDTSFCCNASFGAFAGRSNTRGIGNSFFGYGAGNHNTTGGQNAFFGLNAGGGNTTGSSNTFFGTAAGISNASAEENTAIGFEALYGSGDATGNGNTASGFQALRSNSSGRFNTAIGHSALLSSFNSFFNTASGADALRNNTGSGNTAVGWSSLVSNTTGFNNTAIGFKADVAINNLSNATAIGAGAVVNTSNKVRIGNGVVTRIEGEVPFTAVSDKTKKENFLPLDGEEVLKKIRHIPVTTWNLIGHDPKQFRHYGPTAQDFFAAFGDDGLGTIGTPTTITSGDVEGVLMIAVQALEQRTAEQSEEIDALRSDNTTLKARIEDLERLVKGIQTARREATE